ncbi:MAG: AAA family ATPase [Bacilli bacterium]
MVQVTSQPIEEQTHEQKSTIQAVMDNIGKVIVGKTDVIQLCLVSLIAHGHILLEDVPGVGKTMLVRSLARSLDCQFKRIQFTPDLLPSDVTGTSVFNQRIADFEYRPGPIFGQIVLADEINRTSPKTQAALLEALEEQSVTFDGVTHELPNPFFVLATQNPIEYEGTFPLPEAQLDRFLMKLSVGYPSPTEELSVLARGLDGVDVDSLEPVATPNDIALWQAEVSGVYMDQTIFSYVVDIVGRTRVHPQVYLGVSPRGGIALAKAARAYAYIEGREFVLPDDIKRLAPYVLSHRILVHPEARIQGISAESLLADILRETPIPVLPVRR